MNDKKRITLHNGRGANGQAYGSKHNDRNFDTQNADHIDPERSKGNYYWHCFQKSENGANMTFEEAEKLFYDKYIKAHLDSQNERYTKRRQYKRVKTMDEIRKSQRYCPEESILCIGEMGNNIEPRLLLDIAIDLVNWELRTFKNVKYLNFALHVDEQGTPHIHTRKVWLAKDKDGHTYISEKKALEEMGIERPEPDKPSGKYNNPKITYTQQVRGKFIELAKARGLDIETEPRENGKSGRTLAEYKTEKIREEQKEQAELLNNLKEEQAELLNNLESLENYLDDAEYRKYIHIRNQQEEYER